jgi:hypothetical protein
VVVLDGRATFWALRRDTADAVGAQRFLERTLALRCVL